MNSFFFFYVNALLCIFSLDNVGYASRPSHAGALILNVTSLHFFLCVSRRGYVSFTNRRRGNNRVEGCKKISKFKYGASFILCKRKWKEGETPFKNRWMHDTLKWFFFSSSSLPPCNIRHGLTPLGTWLQDGSLSLFRSASG